MIDKIKEQISEVASFTADNLEAVETFRIKYLGKRVFLMTSLRSLRMCLMTRKKSSGKP